MEAEGQSTERSLSTSFFSDPFLEHIEEMLEDRKIAGSVLAGVPSLAGVAPSPLIY